MNKYHKVVDEEMEYVSIFLKPSEGELDDFICIWVEDEELNINSPFKTLDDADAFADIVLGLLRLMT